MNRLVRVLPSLVILITTACGESDIKSGTGREELEFLGEHTPSQVTSSSNTADSENSNSIFREQEANSNNENQEKIGVILVAGAVTGKLLVAAAKKPIFELRNTLHQKGHHDVQLLKYGSLMKTPREEIESLAATRLAEIVASSSADRFDIIGHSMGHYVALAAVLRAGVAGRVRNFIGLAGVANGGEKPPFGCGPLILNSPAKAQKACPALEGLMRGQDNFIIDDMLARHRADLAKMNLCSIAVENDAFLKPADAGFLPGGRNLWIDWAKHQNIPSSPKIIPYMKKYCGFELPALD